MTNEASNTTDVDLSVLIVGYHSWPLVETTLSTFYANEPTCRYEILFTDCSMDGSAEKIRNAFPNVRIIESGGNLGFAGGNNLLARHARGRHILLLNPDTVINDDAIQTLYDACASSDEQGVWGGVTVLPSGQIDPGCVQSDGGLLSQLAYMVGLGRLVQVADPRERGQTTDVACVSGAFMLLPRDLWEVLEGFDASFFMYREERDLCHRVLKRGGRVRLEPASQITHDVGSGSSVSPRRILLLTQSAMHFARKHHNPLQVLLTGLQIWIAASVRTIGSLPMQLLGRGARARELRAAFGPLMFHPQRWWNGYTDSNPAVKPAATSSGVTVSTEGTS